MVKGVEWKTKKRRGGGRGNGEGRGVGDREEARWGKRKW